MHVAHLVHRSAIRHPQRPLWIGEDFSIPYAEASLRLNRLANGLLARGSQRDRVAILSANRFEAYEVYLAAMNAGMAAVPLNPKLHASEHQFMIADSEARFVVFSPDYAPVVDAIRANLPKVAHWVCFDEIAGSLSYSALLGDGPDTAPDVVIEPDDLAWLFYTSGTTGRPKGAMETHRNLLTMVQQFRQVILTDTDENDVMIHLAPIAHGTASVGLAHIAVGAGQAFPLTRSFEPEMAFKAIERYGVTATFLAPTMIQLLLQSKAKANYNLGSLKNIVYGGGPMYAEVLKQAVDAFGNVFSQIYGQGEAPMTCAGLHKSEHLVDDPALRHRLGSAGREMPGVMIRIVDSDDRPLPTGMQGEITVRSDLVMKGYWNRPEANAETLRGGWLHTGDVGYLDADGYLFVTDRIKDLIISGGSNIYPREVEEVLLEHPAIAEVAVIGIPDEQWGESVLAFVVLRDGHSVADQDLIEFSRARIASYKKPKAIRFVESLPKSAYGKVLKRELRAPFWQAAARNI